jgi:hypothetical protein
MSVEVACCCDELPAHSHVFRHDVVEDRHGNRCARPVDTGEVRIWVDWKAVARELATATVDP